MWPLFSCHVPEDSDSESDIEYARIEQPSIIDQLRRILDEYRNDVQIIKVNTFCLIQLGNYYLHSLIFL